MAGSSMKLGNAFAVLVPESDEQQQRKQRPARRRSSSGASAADAAAAHASVASGADAAPPVNGFGGEAEANAGEEEGWQSTVPRHSRHRSSSLGGSHGNLTSQLSIGTDASDAVLSGSDTPAWCGTEPQASDAHVHTQLPVEEAAPSSSSSVGEPVHPVPVGEGSSPQAAVRQVRDMAPLHKSGPSQVVDRRASVSAQVHTALLPPPCGYCTRVQQQRPRCLRLVREEAHTCTRWQTCRKRNAHALTQELLFYPSQAQAELAAAQRAERLAEQAWRSAHAAVDAAQARLSAALEAEQHGNSAAGKAAAHTPPSRSHAPRNGGSVAPADGHYVASLEAQLAALRVQIADKDKEVVSLRRAEQAESSAALAAASRGRGSKAAANGGSSTHSGGGGSSNNHQATRSKDAGPAAAAGATATQTAGERSTRQGGHKAETGTAAQRTSEANSSSADGGADSRVRSEHAAAAPLGDSTPAPPASAAIAAEPLTPPPQVSVVATPPPVEQVSGTPTAGVVATPTSARRGWNTPPASSIANGHGTAEGVAPDTEAPVISSSRDPTPAEALQAKSSRRLSSSGQI